MPPIIFVLSVMEIFFLVVCSACISRAMLATIIIAKIIRIKLNCISVLAIKSIVNRAIIKRRPATYHLVKAATKAMLIARTNIESYKFICG